MNKMIGRIILTTAVLVLFSLTALGSVCAENTGTSFTEWKDRLLNVKSFTFMRHKDGIGYGDCPVYTAPSEKALRFANNRQACDTDQELYEAGYSEEGWLLVRYDTGTGKTRVGYIPPSYIRGFKSSMSAKQFEHITVIAAEPVSVTDNPLKKGSAYAELGRGEQFTILAKYTYHGDWWYIECTVDGKTARGFIDREKSSFYPGDEVEDNLNQTPVNMQTIGTPSRSPMGTEQTGTILVKGNANDKRKQVHQDANPDSKWVSVVYPTRQYPCYAAGEGTDRESWYYVFVEEDSAWGWVHAGFCTFESSGE